MSMYVVGGHLGGDLGFTPSFKCTNTSCFSFESPETHRLFLALQERLNQFAASAGFSPSTPDGKLGPGTLAAAQKVADWVLRVANMAGPVAVLANNLKALATSKETLAKGAQQALDILVALPAPQSAPSTAPAVRSAAPLPQASMTLPVDPMTAMDRPSPKPRWPLYLAGGIFAVGVLYLAWVLTAPE